MTVEVFLCGLRVVGRSVSFSHGRFSSSGFLPLEPSWRQIPQHPRPFIGLFQRLLAPVFPAILRPARSEIPNFKGMNTVN